MKNYALVFAFLSFSKLLSQVDFSHQNIFKKQTAFFEKADSLNFQANSKLFPKFNFAIHQAFFCRLEDDFWSKNKVKASFRLGSLESCNKIEYPGIQYYKE